MAGGSAEGGGVDDATRALRDAGAAKDLEVPAALELLRKWCGDAPPDHRVICFTDREGVWVGRHEWGDETVLPAAIEFAKIASLGGHELDDSMWTALSPSTIVHLSRVVRGKEPVAFPSVPMPSVRQVLLAHVPPSTVTKLLHQCSNLRLLTIVACGLKNEAAEEVASLLPKVGPLEILNLRANALGTAGGTAIAKQLETAEALWSTLRELNLYSTQLTDDATVALAAALPKLKVLASLNLGWNFIEADGTRALASALAHTSTLRFFDYSTNSVSHSNYRALCKAILTATDNQCKLEPEAPKGGPCTIA